MIAKHRRFLMRTTGQIAGWLQRLCKQRPNAAYVGGWLGSRNLGDEALLPAYRKLFPAMHLTPYTEGRMASLLWRFTPRRVGAFLGGGTLIAQKRMWLDAATAWQHMGNPLAIFGSGVADTAFWPGGASLEEWRPVLEGCTDIFVRGPLSAAVLQTAGFTRVRVCGDPVLAFAQKDPPRRPASAPVLGLNIGVQDLCMWGDPSGVRDTAMQIAKIARAEGWQVEWFVVTPRDADIVQSAAEGAGGGRVHRIYCDARTFLTRASCLTAFAGMKLHATLLANCAMVPSVMFEYDPKCRDYMESIGYGHANYRADALDAKGIWHQLRGWHDGRDAAIARLREAVLGLQSTLIQCADALQIRMLNGRAPNPSD